MSEVTEQAAGEPVSDATSQAGALASLTAMLPLWMGSPRFVHAAAAGFGALVMVCMTGYARLSVIHIAVAALTGFGIAWFALRLGIFAVVAAALLPQVWQGGFSPDFPSPVWIAALVWTTAACSRANLLTAGPTKKRGALAMARPWRREEQDSESVSVWLWELSYVTAAVAILWLLLRLFGAFAGRISGALPGQTEAIAAVAILGLLILIQVVAQVIFALLDAKDRSAEEARLIVFTDLHREIRSEILWFARFIANRRKKP